MQDQHRPIPPTRGELILAGVMAAAAWILLIAYIAYRYLTEVAS